MKTLIKKGKLTEKLTLNEDYEYYIYQLPKDINLLYLKQSINLTPCDIEIIGKVNKKGDNPGDILIQGTKEDIEKFLDDYFDYTINDDYLYNEDEFDTDLYTKFTINDIKENINKSLKEDFETYGYIIRDKFTDEVIEENDRFTSKDDAYDKAVISYKTLLDENPGEDYKIEITNETIDTDFDEALKESEEDDLLELEEPVDEEPIEDEPTDNIEEPVEPVTQEVADNAYLTQINDLITAEYGKIDNVKSIIATFDSEDAIENNSEVISILNEFIDETIISIGILTKASELIDSTTSDLMKQGIEKAEDAIKNIDKEDKKEETEE